MAFIIVSLVLAAALLAYAFRHKFAPDPRRRLADADLVAVLLSLEGQPLEELFNLYKAQFGQNAARYARHTYRKWKAGEVRPNRRTFERFLVHLPEVMSFDLKCEVLRKLRAAYCAHDSYQLTVYTDDWQETLAPLVQSITERAYTSELPQPVGERLKWLSGDEMRAARAILAESQAQESRRTVALLRDEFKQIERVLNGAAGARKVTHELRLPYASITLQIKRRRAGE